MIRFNTVIKVFNLFIEFIFYSIIYLFTFYSLKILFDKNYRILTKKKIT